MVNFKVNENESYQLRLTTRGCISCEKRIGMNPLNIFMGSNLPQLGDLMIILHECLLPFNHGIKIETVYEIYDRYCEAEGSLLELIKVLVEVFKDSGFIPKEDEETKN